MRLLQAVIAVAALAIGLTACSQPAPTPTPTATSTPDLRAEASDLTPDHLTVTVENPLHQTGYPTGPGETSDATTVRKLFDEILALDPFPAGTYFCPEDDGVRFELNFTNDGASVLTATANPTGCRGVGLTGGSYLKAHPDTATSRWTMTGDAGPTFISNVERVAYGDPVP